MKAIQILACGAAATTLLAGCASGGYGERVTAVGYDGFYDDFYGPFNGGYWDNDGFFYYRDGRGFHRDAARHFRRDAAPGFHEFHGRPDRGRDRDHDHDRR